MGQTHRIYTWGQAERLAEKQKRTQIWKNKEDATKKAKKTNQKIQEKWQTCFIPIKPVLGYNID